MTTAWQEEPVAGDIRMQERGGGWKRAAARGATVFALALLAVPAGAQVSSNVVNGAQELAEPTTGALLQGDPDSGFLVCSVTLIGCDAAITTAHCFNTNAGLKTQVYFQHAGFVPIESATRHPAFVAAFPPNPLDTSVLLVEDIAFIKLAEPVTGIRPSSVQRSNEPTLGKPGTIVGFGRDPITAVSAATADRNAGIKRSGTMQLTTCSGSLAGADVLCWDPPVPQGPTGEDVSTCEGDSGGPLFTIENGHRVVSGLTKGAVFIQQGQSDLCEPPVMPYDTSLDRHRDWVQGPLGDGGMIAATGAIPVWDKSCSNLAQLPEGVQSGDGLGNCDGSSWGASPDPRTCGFTGFLDAAGTSSANHSFPVPSGTALLRVAFNGIASSSGAVDTDYYLRASAPATTGQFDCAANGSGNVGFCEFANPTADTWHTLVDQNLYKGEYQVTVTLFGPPPPAGVPALGSGPRVLLMGAMLALPLLLRNLRSRLRPRLRPGSVSGPRGR
jgi:hypothetical protein